MLKIYLIKIIRKISLSLINTFLCTTNFFKLKRFLLKLSGINVGKNTKVVGPVSIGTVASLNIGKNCWIGSGLKIYGNGKVTIGDNCDFAPDISFVTGSHEIGDESRRAGNGTSFEVIIKNSCWVGARVTLLGNITLEESSIVGTCSLVNKSVPKNTIVAGVPAKKIKKL